MKCPTLYGPSDAHAVLVGQSLPTSLDGKPQLGLIRKDLAELCGLDLPTFLDRFARCHLVEYHTGRGAQGGERWPIAEGKAAARALTPRLAGRRVVFLGRNVEQAFELGTPAPWFEWRTAGKVVLGQHFDYAAAPPPSRLLSWWADEGNAERALRFWSHLASWVAGERGVEKAAAPASGAVTDADGPVC